MEYNTPHLIWCIIGNHHHPENQNDHTHHTAPPHHHHHHCTHHTALPLSCPLPPSPPPPLLLYLPSRQSGYFVGREGGRVPPPSFAFPAPCRGFFGQVWWFGFGGYGGLGLSLGGGWLGRMDGECRRRWRQNIHKIFHFFVAVVIFRDLIKKIYIM